MHPDKNAPWTAITYPQDFSGAGAGLGAQTILRLQRLVLARQQGWNITAIVLACGIGPDMRKHPKQTRPFADMMKEWLVAEGTFPTDLIRCSANHKAWNCMEVTLEMLKMIKAQGLSRNVLVASTGFHIYPRMWMTWFLLCGGRKDWRLGFTPAWEGTYNIPHELGGTIKYIPMALWYRGKI
jgi:hypothetical protein